MSERLRESLSALMDDAADDLELARVLRAMDEDEEVGDTWSRYHLVSALLRGGEAGAAEVHGPVGPVAIDLEAPALEGDGAPELAGVLEGDGLPAGHGVPHGHGVPEQGAVEDGAAAPGNRRALPAWATSFAAAASVTLAIVVALQWFGPAPEAPAVVAAPVDTGPVRADALGLLPAADGPYAAPRPPQGLRIAPPFAPGPAPSAALSEAERQVDAYMLYHAEYSAANAASGMVPMARYAAFEGGRRAP